MGGDRQSTINISKEAKHSMIEGMSAMENIQVEEGEQTARAEADNSISNGGSRYQRE